MLPALICAVPGVVGVGNDKAEAVLIEVVISDRAVADFSIGSSPNGICVVCEGWGYDLHRVGPSLKLVVSVVVVGGHGGAVGFFIA